MITLKNCPKSHTISLITPDEELTKEEECGLITLFAEHVREFAPYLSEFFTEEFVEWAKWSIRSDFPLNEEMFITRMR